jgi:hypothetical protein
VSVVTVGAAQLGPIARSEGRPAAVKRLVAPRQEEMVGVAKAVTQHYRLIVERTGAAPPA